jgi:hypothetical protein
MILLYSYSGALVPGLPGPQLGPKRHPRAKSLPKAPEARTRGGIKRETKETGGHTGDLRDARGGWKDPTPRWKPRSRSSESEVKGQVVALLLLMIEAPKVCCTGSWVCW